MLCRALDAENMQRYLGYDSFDFDGGVLLDKVCFGNEASFEQEVDRREIFP